MVREKVLMLPAAAVLIAVALVGGLRAEPDADGVATTPNGEAPTRSPDSGATVAEEGVPGPAGEGEESVHAAWLSNEAWGAVPAPISRDTTWITEPLDDSGRIDYAEAISQFASQGVTRENNAAIPLLEVLGPEALDEAARDEVTERLGLRFDAEAEHFRNVLGESDEDRILLMEQRDLGMRSPWSAEQYPLLAAWVLANETHLDRLTQAVRRPRYYVPVVSLIDVESTDSWAAPVDYSLYRVVMKAQLCRAMQLLDAGAIDAAWDDVITTARLGRLLATGPLVMDHLIGASIERAAYETARAFAEDGRTPGPVLKKLQEELAILPPRRPLSQVLDGPGRYLGLHTISELGSRGTVGSLVRLGMMSISNDESMDEFLMATPSAGDRCEIPLSFDVGELMREYHSEFGPVLAAYDAPSPGEGLRRLGRLAKDAKGRSRQARGEITDLSWLSSYVVATPDDRRVMMGDVLSHLVAGDPGWGMKAPLRVLGYSEVALAHARLCFALTAFHEREGRYPENLGALVPADIARVPDDPFSGQPIRYRRTDEGCLIYSVGENLKDDGGVVGEAVDGSSGDIVLRLPLAD